MYSMQSVPPISNLYLVLVDVLHVIGNVHSHSSVSVILAMNGIAGKRLDWPTMGQFSGRQGRPMRIS